MVCLWHDLTKELTERNRLNAASSNRGPAEASAYWRIAGSAA